MSIHVALHHVTHYDYDRLINLGPQIVRLRPAPHCRTRILSYSLRVEPAKHFINWQQDPQANYLARLVFPETTRKFRIEVDLVAEMAVINPFDFFLEPHAEYYPFEYEPWQRAELTPYLGKEPLTPLFERYLAAISRQKMRSVPFLVELNRKLAGDVEYLIRMEPGVQTPEETLVKRSGSCRDSGWLLVQLLRHLGLAARFVSGYLIQLTADVKSLDGPSGPEKDFTDLHAWAEVYLPGAGWIGLDPTSGLFAGEGHLPLACTPEPGSASPITGSVDKCEVRFSHQMSITRIWEAPRVTKPYTEEQWQAIDQLGQAVDADLTSNDVRLTMGGEPTFVSIDDPEGEEWNMAALGPSKRKLAADLYHRLRKRYGTQGLVHFGQGKWYPGEQLPRWSLNCFWRADGEPIWLDEALIADETRAGNATDAAACQFLRGVAERLGLDASFVFPGYEDLFYYMWCERRLPTNVDPFDSRLEDPLERERLMRIFTKGLNEVVGYALPVVRDLQTGHWRSGRWFLRAGHCYLVPGDSPMGYRLPLDSQPWASPSDYPVIFPLYLTQQFPPLASHAQIHVKVEPARAAGIATSHRPVGVDERGKTDRIPNRHESAAWITRATMCVEPRNGVLYVFMPPTDSVEDYLELVAAAEVTAKAMNQPILFEGYEPPRDPRLPHFRITPDPGVIEVNIHPSARWDELVEHTTFLYDAARESRLATEKFMIDGRHTGTGGGNRSEAPRGGTRREK